MHILCSTSRVVVLVAAFDKDGVVRFPSNGSSYPGLHFACVQAEPINPQIMSTIKQDLDLNEVDIHIWQEFREVVYLPVEYEPAEIAHSLYLAIVDQDKYTAKREWQSMPELMRSMPKDKKRIPFLKAWQVLTGGLKLNTKAIETGELMDMLKPESQE